MYKCRIYPYNFFPINSVRTAINLKEYSKTILALSLSVKAKIGADIYEENPCAKHNGSLPIAQYNFKKYLYRDKISVHR